MNGNLANHRKAQSGKDSHETTHPSDQRLIGGEPEDWNTAAGGGGILNEGTLVMTSCTIGKNTAATLNGGGISNHNSADNASASIHSCTFSENIVASSNGSGGGIYNPGTNSLGRGNTTVASNSVQSGGSGPNIFGKVTSDDGFNLIRNGADASGFSQPSDQVGTAQNLVNANLGPLQANGGPTDTYKPGSGSKAIDQGVSYAGMTMDQRGRMRRFDNPNIPNVSGGDGTDIGAFEVQPPITSTVKNVNPNGPPSFAQQVLDADNGDTIDASQVTGTISLFIPIDVLNGITINGPGPRLLTLAAAKAGYSVLYFEKGSSLVSGLTITNSQFSSGGGIAVVAGSFPVSLEVANCTVTGNQAVVAGGGVANISGTVFLHECTISNNTTSGGGGGVSYEGASGSLTLRNCTVTGNTAANGGGLLLNGGDNPVELINCTIASNTGNSSNSSDGGGGIRNEGAPVTLTNTIVANNTHNQQGRDLFGDFRVPEVTTLSGYRMAAPALLIG